jgi:hypothetical protein
MSWYMPYDAGTALRIVSAKAMIDSYEGAACAGGGGAQYKFGSWAVRAEYERFNAAGGNPSLLSAGVTWAFFDRFTRA